MKRLALLAGLLLATHSCGAGATLNVELDKSARVPALSSVVLVVRDLQTDTPTVYGPVDLVETPQFRIQAQVRPGRELYLDVFGCDDRKACEGAYIVARGCSDVLKLAEGEARPLVVTLHPSAGEYDLEPVEGEEMPPRGCPPVGPHSRPRPAP